MKIGTPLIIGGPCAIESKEQLLTIAKDLHEMGVKIFRCQLWKPRTDPTSFQGVGLKGLPWLKEIKEKYGVLIAGEITDRDQIAETQGVLDILWVGARNMQNYELLKALGEDNRPVILKRGFIATMDEWLKAGKYIGLEKVILCERGVRTGADSMRFTLDINSMLIAKYDHNMPIIVDPSHTAGRADMVPFLAYGAIAAGADGIVIEVHNEPEKALCDASQQITPIVFKEVIEKINTIYKVRHNKDSVNKFQVHNAQLGKKAAPKTLLFVAVKNRVGILRDILNIFADFDLNLDKLESHPIKDKAWDYYFSVGVEATKDEERLIQAIKILQELSEQVRIVEEY